MGLEQDLKNEATSMERFFPNTEALQSAIAEVSTGVELHIAAYAYSDEGIGDRRQVDESEDIGEVVNEGNGSRTRFHDGRAKEVRLVYGNSDAQVVYGTKTTGQEPKRPEVKRGYKKRRERKLPTSRLQYIGKVRNLLRAVSGEHPRWAYAIEIMLDLQDTIRGRSPLFGNKPLYENFLHDIGTVIMTKTPVTVELVGRRNMPSGYTLQPYAGK